MTSRGRRAILSAVTAVGLAAITAVHVDFSRDVQRDYHEALIYSTAVHADRLRCRIRDMIHAVEGLGAFLTATPSLPNHDAFDHYARQAVLMHPTLRVLQRVDAAGVVVDEFPLEGNETALGLDLKTLPDWSYLGEARRMRRTIVGPNPGPLVQGPLGAIVRTPLYRDNVFLGWAQGVYDVENLMLGAKSKLAPPQLMQLVDSEGDVLLGSKRMPDSAISVPVESGGSTWQLRVAWATPARRVSSVALASIWGSGLCLLAAVLWGLRAGWRNEEALRLAVQKRTADLTRTNEQLQAEVTERKQAEDALRVSEQRFRHIFAGAPISIWEEDFSAVGEWLESLRTRGVCDLDAFLQQEPRALEQALSLVRLIDVNDMTLRLFEVESKEELLRKWSKLFTDDTFEVFTEEVRAIWDGRTRVDCECSARTARGRTIHYQMHWVAPLEDGQLNLGGVVIALADVTEQKVQQELLQTILDNIPVMVVFVDASGRTQWVNRHWIRVLGWSLADATSCDILSEMYPDPEYRKHALEFARAGDGSWADFHTRVKDGRTIETTWANVSLTDGRSIGIGIDITERKQAEEALRIKDSAIASSINGVAIADLAGRLTYVNPAFVNLWGYANEREILGKSVLSFWHEPTQAREVVRAIQDSGSWTGELLGLRRNGSHMSLYLAASTVLDDKGAPICMMASFVDITDRKRAEDAQHAHEAKYRYLVEQLPVITYTAALDEIGGTTFVSPQVEAFLGESPQVWMDNPELWSSRIHPDDRDRVLTAWNDACRNDEPFRAEYRMTACDGSEFWFVDEARIMRDGQGKPLLMQGVMLDISQRKHAENALRQSEKRLHHLSRRLLEVQEEERRHLARELHDEFGQLLATIAVQLHVAMGVGGEATQPHLEECMTLLQSAGEQVRSLATELRPAMLERSELDVAVRWLAEQHQQRTGIATEVVGHAHSVSGDLAVACFRIAQEALTNVLRHAQAEHAWIELSQTERVIKLVIRDDGIGFDVVQALEGNGERERLGLLGMRERVQIFAGRLEVDSAPGSGTRICAVFPLTPPSREPQERGE